MQALSFPEGYEWKEGVGICRSNRKNEKVSNAVPIVVRRSRVRSYNIDEKKEVFELEFILENEMGLGKVEITKQQLVTGTFIKEIPIEVIVQPSYRKKIVDIYRVIIQEQLSLVPITEVIEYQFGWNGKMFFWKEGVNMPNENIKNSSYSNAMMLANIISGEEIVASVVLAAIHGPLKRLLEDADIKHDYVTYIVGETGIGKTEVVQKICNYLPNKNVFLSLGNERKNLKNYMQKLGDVTLIVDDFSTTASHRMRDRQLHIMSEIIQNASDSGKILTEYENSNVSSGNIHLIVTGESLIKNFSTLNRCFVVSMEECLGSDTWNDLSRFSTEGKMYEFMQQFVLWVQENFDETVEKMKVNYKQYLNRANTSLRDNISGIQRIRNTVAVQMTIRKCFMDYLSFVNIDDRVFSEVKNTISRCIWNSADELCSHILGLKKEQKRMIYLTTLAELITQIGNGFWIADSEKKYKKCMNRNTKNGLCIGVCITRGYWSFDVNSICKILAEILGVESVSKRCLGKDLDTYSLAHKDSEGKMSSRWHSEMRLYHVRVEPLLELVYPDYDMKSLVTTYFNIEESGGSVF